MGKSARRASHSTLADRHRARVAFGSSQRDNMTARTDKRPPTSGVNPITNTQVNDKHKKKVKPDSKCNSYIRQIAACVEQLMDRDKGIKPLAKNLIVEFKPLYLAEDILHK